VKMEAGDLSETTTPIYHTTRRHITKDCQIKFLNTLSISFVVH